METFSFKNFLEQNTLGYHNDGQGPFQKTEGSYLSSDQTGSEQPDHYLGHSLHLPSLDFTIPEKLPQINKTAKISKIEMNKNPIQIYLRDGTVLYLSYYEFKRIKGQPQVGKTLSVDFEKHADDGRGIPFKINKISIS